MLKSWSLPDLGLAVFTELWLASSNKHGFWLIVLVDFFGVVGNFEVKVLGSVQ